MPVLISTSIRAPKTTANAADLRQSIEKRLFAFRTERRRLQARLALVMEIEKEYELLLAEADQMTLSQEINESAKLSEIIKNAEEEESPNGKLKEFLLSHVTHQAQGLDDLVGLALSHGFNFGTKSPARVLHFNLLNLKNAGLIEKDGDKWKSVRN